jgi:GTPase SAR1 family protein
VCINSLPFEECPDAIAPDNPASEAAEELIRTVPSVALPGGRSLEVEECDAMLRQRGGTVIGLVAGPNVGKTTLIATIYELLHRRRMAEFGFAGSETLRGYEERCFLARLSSKAPRPDTQRTALSAPLSFTHLRIVLPDGMRDVVFSDRSGEFFEKALERPAEIGTFIELQRADAIILLVDLERLVSETHVTVSAIRRIFMAMDQNKLLEGRKVLLVGTKADTAISAREDSSAGEKLVVLAEDLNRRAAGRFAVSRHVVACRARIGTTVFGEGVERLLSELLAAAQLQVLQADDSWPSERSELDQIMRRYRSELS